MPRRPAIQSLRDLRSKAQQAGYFGAQRRWGKHSKKVRKEVLEDVSTFCEAVSGASRVRMRISRNCFSNADRTVALRAHKRLGVKIQQKRVSAHKGGFFKVTPTQTLAIGRERQTSIARIATAFVISPRQAGTEMKVHAEMVVKLQIMLLNRLCVWLETARPQLDLGLVTKCYDGASHRVRTSMHQAWTQASKEIEKQRQSTVDIEAAEVPLSAHYI